MKNQQVCLSFVQGDRTAKTKNLFIEGSVLYSYGYHFPLCIRLQNGFIVNADGYSKTTGNHKGYLIREMTQENSFKDFQKAKQKGQYENILLMNTEQLKTLINEFVEFGDKTAQDIKNFQVLKNL